MCVWWRAGAGSPRLAKGPILCVLSLSMFFMGAGLWGEPWQSLGEGANLALFWGSQVTAGEDRPAHLHVPSMGPLAGMLASTTPKMFFGIQAFLSGQPVQLHHLSKLLLKDTCYKSSLSLTAGLYRANPVLMCLQCVMSFPHPRYSALGPLLVHVCGGPSYTHLL